MLKVAVFDCGYGGEMLADQLEENLPVIQVIRIIDWRHLKDYESNSRLLRQRIADAIRPYIGRVDLIIFANHLVSITNLKYFRRKHKNQKFIGLKLKPITKKPERETIILTTKAITHTINYYNYLFRLKCRPKTLALDAWVSKIDDGELTYEEFSNVMHEVLPEVHHQTYEIILASANFNDLRPMILKFFGRNTKIYDSFDDTIRQACKVLKIRGGIGKKRS